MKIDQGAVKRDRFGTKTERIPGGEGATRTVRPDPAAERAADEAPAGKTSKPNVNHSPSSR